MQEAVFHDRPRAAMGQPVQHYLEELFNAHAYPWPRPNEMMALADLAATFAVAPNLLSRHLDQWLTADLWDDRRLAQDFRAAMLWLCLSRLEPDGADTAEPVMQWLRGEKVAPALLRSADISVRISRTNARPMLVSLCHFLRKAGAAGLLVVLDVRPLSRTAAAEDTLRYSPAAVMDTYEVLREIIDDAENLPGLFVLFWLTRRWPPAIRAARWGNTPRCRCASGPMCGPATGRTRWPRWLAGSVTVESRMAIEALRVGVPELGRHSADGHRTDLDRARLRAGVGRCLEPIAGDWRWRGATGIGLAGGFGTGKSHMLGYLAEVARQQGFVVSRVVVSKETPLSHPGHVLAAALRDAALPDRPDDPIAACVFALREQPEALDALEIAVSKPDAGFAPIFAACLFLCAGRPRHPRCCAASRACGQGPR